MSPGSESWFSSVQSPGSGPGGGGGGCDLTDPPYLCSPSDLCAAIGPSSVTRVVKPREVLTSVMQQNLLNKSLFDHWDRTGSRSNRTQPDLPEQTKHKTKQIPSKMAATAPVRVELRFVVVVAEPAPPPR